MQFFIWSTVPLAGKSLPIYPYLKVRTVSVAGVPIYIITMIRFWNGTITIFIRSGHTIQVVQVDVHVHHVRDVVRWTRSGAGGDGSVFQVILQVAGGVLLGRVVGFLLVGYGYHAVVLYGDGFVLGVLLQPGIVCPDDDYSISTTVPGSYRFRAVAVEEHLEEDQHVYGDLDGTAYAELYWGVAEDEV